MPATISSNPSISRSVQIVHTENMSLRVTPEWPVEISAALATDIRRSRTILSNVGPERRSARTFREERNLEEFAKVYAAHRHLDLPETSRLSDN
ncbi:hypothetical protein HOE425_240011 [Hoeflea sp. EC-HK425]|nr:hypothetical protein HOE425_240011 [Hoeflea sp. EC-HK425]